MPPPSDVYRMLIVGSAGTSGVISTLHMMTRGSGLTPLLVLNDFTSQATFVNRFLKLVHSTCTFFQVVAERVYPAPRTTAQMSVNWVGNDFGGRGVNSMACLLNLYTARADRSGRGRWYVGPLGLIMQQNGGVLSTTGTGTAAEVFNATYEAFAEVGGTSPNLIWGVYSRKLNEFNSVTGYTASASVALLRTRKPGRGF